MLRTLAELKQRDLFWLAVLVKIRCRLLGVALDVGMMFHALLYLLLLEVELLEFATVAGAVWPVHDRDLRLGHIPDTVPADQAILPGAPAGTRLLFVLDSLAAHRSGAAEPFPCSRREWQ